MQRRLVLIYGVVLAALAAAGCARADQPGPWAVRGGTSSASARRDPADGSEQASGPSESLDHAGKRVHVVQRVGVRPLESSGAGGGHGPD
jgi:hypothetical protein